VRRRPPMPLPAPVRRTTWPSSARRLDACIRSPSAIATTIGQRQIRREMCSDTWNVGRG
jgi:hypothetical protein